MCLSWPRSVFPEYFRPLCKLPALLHVLLQLAPGLPLSRDGLPAVRRLTNVYHPYDPVAHRYGQAATWHCWLTESLACWLIG